MLENGVFPFTPEQLSGMNDDLEKVLMTPRDRFSYELVPNVIPSQGTDLYATWLGQMTHADLQERERAGASVLKVNPKRLIYQPTPFIGERDGVTIYKPFYPRGSVTFSAEFHSHPDLSCFGGTDLKRMGIMPGRVSDPMVHLVATRFRNYMVMLTKQTPYAGPDQVSQDFRAIDYDLHSDYPSVEDMFTEKFGKVNFDWLISMAERYKWGVYYSNQDGVFRRLTSSNVVQHVTENVQKAIDDLFPLTETGDQLAIGANS